MGFMRLWVLYWYSHAYAGSGPGLGSGMLSAVFLLFVSLFTISEVTSDLGWDKDEDFTNRMHLHTYSGVEYRNFHFCWEGSWISVCVCGKVPQWKVVRHWNWLSLTWSLWSWSITSRTAGNCLLCSSFVSMLVLRMSKMLKPFWTSFVV